MIRIGLDLGGTKIEAIAMDRDGAILHRERIPTPRAYDASLAAIRDLVNRVEDACGHTAAVGIGHPGSLSPANGLMRNANSTWLNDRPFFEDMARTLDRPLRLANDADCFALSEAVDGAGRDGHIVFGVILGTGVGGGIVIDKRLLSGAQRIAGEWGHNPLPWPQAHEVPGPRCWCGQRGCIETWLSGPGMAARHEAEEGDTRTAAALFSAAASGDPSARRSITSYTDRLARALASVCNLIDPDVIVLGGGVSNAPGLPEAVQARLPAHVFSDVVTTRIVRHHHGDSSGVRGAAWLWRAEEV